MEPKQTPAPWTTEYRGYLRDANGHQFALVFGHPSLETDAVAQMIAAAPDLLAALEEIANMDHDYYCEGYCGVDVARAAIAKARGEA